jgi:hypothetical protein
MKTPREILLARHRAVEPRLDAIHREIVEELNNQDAKAQSRVADFVSSLLCGPNKLWLELIWPCRRTWTALGGVWIALFIFNASQRDKAELAARKLPPPSPEAVMAWRQQERLLAELIGASGTGDAEQRKIFLPQPRSEGCMGNFFMT